MGDQKYLIMKCKKFYRVSNLDTKQGLWYDMDGNFTGLIHTKYNFCMNTDLEMPFDTECIDYLSATDDINTLFNWFTVEDISQLRTFGYEIVEYESEDYKFHNNHWLINKHSLQNEKVIQLDLVLV